MLKTFALLDTLLLGRIGFHLLYLAFAILVTHACQRVVEQTTHYIEPEERKAGLPRASFCIGCLVWALDVAGFLLYPWTRLEDARLVPALVALVFMIVIARFIVPSFATTYGFGRTWKASVGMGLCVLGVHLTVASSLGRFPVGIRVMPLGLALGLAALIAIAMAVAHRSHWAQVAQSTVPRGFRAVSWNVKVLVGLAVVVLHRVLDAGVPLEPRKAGGFGGGLPALLILVLFIVIVTLDQALGLGADRKRGEVFDRALALLRSANVPSSGAAGRQLCAVADRVEAILDAPTFQMHFQPIVDLPIACNRARFEALMRAFHPELGAVAPELFFLACERRGLTAKADRIVLREALRASLPWIPATPRVAGIAVNVGPQTLLDPDFVPWLEGLLQELRVPLHWLELEITEHAMVATGGPMQAALMALNELGVRTCLDDFGSGFSALGLLPQLAVSGLKCDRSLLLGASGNPKGRVVLEQVCGLAQALRIGATVEGIETAEDLELVQRCGASQAQGYWLARPMAAEAVPGWLAAWGRALSQEPAAAIEVALQEGAFSQ